MALLLCSASYSNAQDISTTGNLASPNNPSKWTSGCWTPTQEGFWGGTSGGPCPGIWDNNTVGNGQQIIFSYGQVTLSQTHALAAALPNSGTGLQVNGYNYYWDVKNSNINGNQPGGYDTTAYIDVTLLDASGNSLINDRYNYGYQINNWTTFSGTRTYDNPYSLANADSIRLSVTGKDNQNWAGYYGPEFKWFGLSVNYSVDPCYDNPLYSPTCSGFAEALAKLTASATPSTEDTTGVPEVTQYGNTSTSSVPEETTVAATPTIDAGGIEVSATGELTIPGDAPKETVEQKQVAEEKKEEKKVTVDYSLVAAVVRQAIDLTNVMSVVNQSIMQSTESQVPAGSSSGVEEITLTETTIEQSSTTQDSPVANATMSQDNNSTQTTQTEATQTTQQTTQQQAKKQPNEAAAGGVSMDSFAKAPAGFDAYQTQLADASFYAPKEIYKGQVNVDNRRAMRALGSDRLHQEMVRQQYRR